MVMIPVYPFTISCSAFFSFKNELHEKLKRELLTGEKLKFVCIEAKNKMLISLLILAFSSPNHPLLLHR